MIVVSARRSIILMVMMLLGYVGDGEMSVKGR